MRDQFSNAQQIRKPAISSKGGLVAAQSHKAAEVDAEVIAARGEELIVLGRLRRRQAGDGDDGCNTGSRIKNLQPYVV